MWMYSTIFKDVCRLSDRQTHSHSIIESSSWSSLEQSNLVITTHHPIFWNTLQRSPEGKNGKCDKDGSTGCLQNQQKYRDLIVKLQYAIHFMMHAHIIPTIKNHLNSLCLKLLHKNLRSPTPHHRRIYHYLIMCT